MIALPFILNAIFNFAIGLLIARFLGPAEFGYYAFAASIAITLATFGFDWIRLSATRFYSERDRQTHPEIRATLNAVFALIASVAVVLAIAIAIFHLRGPLPTTLLSLSVGLAVANGLFDLSTALLRARFLDRAYAVFIITKNLLSIALAVGGAWYFHSAAAALVGLILSVAGSLVLRGKVLWDPQATLNLAQGGIALRYAGYGLPLVLSTMLYQIVPMMNRGFVAHVHGYAEAGKYALAFDVGTRIVAAIGSALDVFLFQLAVAAEKTHGMQAARALIARNMVIVFAITVPTIVGCWLVMPSFEHLLVPQPFRGAFGYYFTLMSPAMLCFALTNFAAAPAFQIQHRTVPLIICGLVALIADVVAILYLPASRDATTFAIAQSISSAVGFVTTIGFLLTLEPIWPRARDVVGVVAATAVMVFAVLPLRGMAPGLLTLLEQAIVGACVYGLVAGLLDVASLRGFLLSRVGVRSQAPQQKCGP